RRKVSHDRPRPVARPAGGPRTRPVGRRGGAGRQAERRGLPRRRPRVGRLRAVRRDVGSDPEQGPSGVGRGDAHARLRRLAPARLTPPPTLVDTTETRQARARSLAAVANTDRDLGLAYDAARRHLGTDTLFLFTSDHGAQFPFGKWNGYDAGVRTPLIVA